MDKKLDEKEGISRRGFMAGAAAVAAGAAGGFIADTKIAEAAGPRTDTGAHLSVDLCIIGGAGAGLVAAVSALEAGVKNIVVLEKMDKIFVIGIDGATFDVILPLVEKGHLPCFEKIASCLRMARPRACR